METNYPAVICQGKQQRGRGGPGQAGDKQPSQATLFMAFLCISVFIWTFLSWRAGLLLSCMPQHLHGAGRHQRQVICLWGSWTKSQCCLWDLVSVSLGPSLVQGSCFRNGDEVLGVQVMGRSG